MWRSSHGPCGGALKTSVNRRFHRGVAIATLYAGLLGGCSQADPPGPEPDPEPEPEPQWESVCPDAEARLGKRVCVHAVPDSDTWEAIAFPAKAVDQIQTTTYMLPAREDARLAPLFVDASGFENPEQSLHFQFLTQSFPEFEHWVDDDGKGYMEYVSLVLPDTREWFAGSITQYVVDGEVIYGFGIHDEALGPDTGITCAQFEEVYGILDERFASDPLAITPFNSFQAEVLVDCDVPQYDPSTALDYEVYNKAKGCGTVRRYTLPQLALAEQAAEFGFQDVLVVDEAPLDIQTVISGVITGTRQGELSHLNVRSAARGTPNCYMKDVHALMEPWEGKLVELECGPGEATVVEITLEEAQECWDDLRPDPVEVVPPQTDTMELVGLLDLVTETPDARRDGVSRYGSKGTNLATLYQRIDPELALEGFLIPFFYYDRFVQQNGWMVDVGNGAEMLTFAETITAYLADDEFQSDGAVRRQKLLLLEDAMKAAPCDDVFIADLDAKIIEVFGDDTTMVRFRSSSNAEDALGFNGAGLYDSTSACLADENDMDAVGPSACDPDQPEERDLCRAMNRVWASLWKMKAFEERDWYGIDHEQVMMGILVNTRTKGELANIVAFSGNPLIRGDDRYLVNAQAGELDVVAAQPGVWPEKDLLELDDSGAVIDIERARGSTELPEGEWVLSDARLGELGAALWTIVDVYPVDAEPLTPAGDILLDTEWKLRADGRLAIKQIRPFPDD